MAVLENNKEVPQEKNILLEKWKIETVCGNRKPEKPGYCVFNNIAYALDLLKKHIDCNSKIALHTDVDVDGIGTTYIFKKALNNLGSNNHLLLINRDKIHGIQQKHVDYFRDKPLDLMIITDSSTNEIEIIKQFNCDVLVVDHHDVSQKMRSQLLGLCNDGVHRYVIVNNTIGNSNQEFDNKWLRNNNISAFESLEEYQATQDMSCGLVVYELLRLYCECFASPKLLENLMLYQWVGVTLITDVINTLNERNQWYLEQTVFNNSVEASLNIMMRQINRFKATLDKSYINYSFAPLINKAIRAGDGAKALDIVINRPQDIMQLEVYKEIQQKAIDSALEVEIVDPETQVRTKAKRVFKDKNIILDISKLGIKPSYTGVIASRLGGDHHKNAAVYCIDEDGLCKGSFRGRYNYIDYREYFENFADDIYAQGHPPAFGFKLRLEQLRAILDSIESIEPDQESKPWLTLGSMKPEEYGKYHIDSLDDFKKLGYIWRIAIGNSKVTSKDEVNIKVKSSDVVFKNTKGKLFFYDVLGMECKAFKILTGEYLEIYPEYTNEVNIYIR